ncbi:ribosome recycling factor [Lophiostoma macrostomum CBS 122681]|uniref:Ribosome recycling factor n=1 Tax=Lophiostoma macrostomum CBS 122681 TaxID=1314788 RepID=A0A6A6SLF5_9PLEO|nr:ribosome recycling factor [Lophiostoma macrostomum CBS 122681]
MSHVRIPRAALRLTSHASRSLRSQAIDPPCQRLHLRATHLPPQTQCSTTATRRFTTSPPHLKKAGKANKSHARSDSSPPVTDLSGSTPTDEAYDVSGLEAAILKAMERLTHDLAQLRAGGRLNPELIESLKVQLGTAREGKEMVRLRDIAQVVPKGRVVNVMASEAEHIKPLTSAIASSSHNLTPSPPDPSTPLTIPVPLPPPTGESRQAALDAAHKASEAADKAIQTARAAHNKKLRKYEKDRAVLPDDLQKARKVMEDVVKKGHGEVKRIVEGARRVLESV